jgi:ankyrin repeat protein
MEPTQSQTTETYPLHDAVLRADRSDVERLMAEGADVNAVEDYRMSSLVWAVYGGYLDIVEALCQAGADVNQRVGPGETALWHAEDNFGLWEIAAVLRRHGASEK